MKKFIITAMFLTACEKRADIADRAAKAYCDKLVSCHPSLANAWNRCVEGAKLGSSGEDEETFARDVKQVELAIQTSCITLDSILGINQ